MSVAYLHALIKAVKPSCKNAKKKMVHHNVMRKVMLCLISIGFVNSLTLLVALTSTRGSFSNIPTAWVADALAAIIKAVLPAFQN